MGGPSLTLRGAFDGYVIHCDGEEVGRAGTFAQASAQLHRLRAIRAFAREELFHTLSKKDA